MDKSDVANERIGNATPVGSKLWLVSWLCAAVLALSSAPTLAADVAASGAGRVVADGLRNPRGLVVAEDGALYVTEAGSGGRERIGNWPQPFGPSGRGDTGRVTRIGPDGAQSVVAKGLPSLALGGFEVVGPDGIAAANGYLWVANGTNAGEVEPEANEAAVLRIDPSTGDVKRVAHLAAYEREENPDGFIIESDPYGIAAGRDGVLYVADAGGNVLYRVDSAVGSIEVAVVFDGLPSPQPNPARRDRKEIDPVPTGVAVDVDGSVYVGFLSGFPFPQGAAKVVKVAPDGHVSDYATGLTGIVDIEFGPDGQLYVSQFGSRFDAATQPPGWEPGGGRVIRVTQDGEQEVVASGINEANGIAFDAAGNLYVVENSDVTPQEGAVGRVMRFDGVADESPRMPNTGAGGGSEGTPRRYAAAVALIAVLAGGSTFAWRRPGRNRR